MARLPPVDLEKIRASTVELCRGLDIVDLGFADVRLYAPAERGLEVERLLPSYKTAIVYLTPLKRVLERYGKWYAVSLVNHISKTNQQIVGFLTGMGYWARGIGENEYSRKTLLGKISFRRMAVLAGLGSIGRSTMLIHPKYGPRVVIGVVLTSAPFEPDNPMEEQYCTECGVCGRLCPVGAVGASFDRWMCQTRRRLLGKGCGIPCVEACPVGRT